MRSIISTRKAAVALAALSLATGVAAASAAGGGSPNGHATGSTTLKAPSAALPPGTDLQFHSLAPCRVADTRIIGGSLNHATRNFATVGGLGGQGGSAGGCGVPTTAVSAQLNVVAIARGSAGFLTAFPAGTPLPLASTVNHGTSGSIVANMVTVPLNSAAQFAIYSWAKTDIVVDVAGYYTKPMYVNVTSTGGIYQGIASGVLSTSRSGVGAYTVEFNRNVKHCAITASDIIFSTTHDISIDQGFSSDDTTVTVRVTNAANAPDDTFFQLVATC